LCILSYSSQFKSLFMNKQILAKFCQVWAMSKPSSLYSITRCSERVIQIISLTTSIACESLRGKTTSASSPPKASQLPLLFHHISLPGRLSNEVPENWKPWKESYCSNEWYLPVECHLVKLKAVTAVYGMKIRSGVCYWEMPATDEIQMQDRNHCLAWTNNKPRIKMRYVICWHVSKLSPSLFVSFVILY